MIGYLWTHPVYMTNFLKLLIDSYYLIMESIPERKRRLAGCLPVILEPRLIQELESRGWIYQPGSINMNSLDIDNSDMTITTDDPLPEIIELVKRHESEHVTIEPGSVNFITVDDSKEWTSLEKSFNNVSPVVCLLSSRTNPGFFIIPKGGVHRSEPECCGAMREAWEEGGIVGKCGRMIAQVQAEKSNAHYFEMIVKKIYDEWPEKHERSRIFVRLADLDKITNILPSVKKILERWKKEFK